MMTRLIAIALLTTLASVAGQTMPVPVSLAGRVIDDAGNGVAGALVLATDISSGVSASIRSGSDGRFVLSRVPPGRYEITARVQGFLAGRFGAMAPGEDGVPVRVAPGIAVPPLEITLDRPATIAGRVTDDRGEPMASALQALQPIRIGPDLTVRRIAVTMTGAEGGYLLTGLPPGRYLVVVTPLIGPSRSAALPEPASPDEPRTSLTLPVFYPGVTTPTQAVPVVVGAGDQVPGIDIVVSPRPVTGLTATVTSGSRRAMQFASLLLMPESVGDVGAHVVTAPDPTPAPTTVLQLPAVAEGRYVLMASALEARDDGTLERVWARESVDVDGRTPVRLSVELRPGATLSGRAVTESGGAAGSGLPDTWLWPLADAYPAGVLPFTGTLEVESSGEFVLAGIAPGRYLLQFGRDSGPQARAAIGRVMLSGSDIVDLPLDLRVGDIYTDVVVTVGSQLGEIGGLLTDQAGQPRHDVTMIAFAVDSRYWWPGTRRIQTARPDTAGEYVVSGLPEGEYFLAAYAGALPENTADGQWLGGLSAQAVRLAVRNGARTEQSLRAGRE
jgi:hypothetical protein